MAAALRPKARVAVGWKAKAAVLSEQLAPDLTEKAAASIYDGVQMRRAPPGDPTPGNLQTSSPGGDTVNGGLRARWREEAQRAVGARPSPPT